VTRVARDGGTEFDVELVDGADVAGRVVDSRDQPVDGVEVVVNDIVTQSAADGSFALHGIDVEGAPGIGASKQGTWTRTDRSRRRP